MRPRASVIRVASLMLAAGCSEPLPPSAVDAGPDVDDRPPVTVDRGDPTDAVDATDVVDVVTPIDHWVDATPDVPGIDRPDIPLDVPYDVGIDRADDTGSDVIDVLDVVDAPDVVDAGRDVADVVAVDAGACPPIAPLCTAGWCWREPLPQGNPIRAFWGTSEDDVWAVGMSGVVFRRQSGCWRHVPSGTTRDLLAVGGSAANDVWAVGIRGAIFRWNGSAWSDLSLPVAADFTGVQVTSPTDALVAGRGYNVRRWDGRTWTTLRGGGLNSDQAYGALSASGPDDVYMVGGDWSARWNGTALGDTDLPTGAGRNFVGLWAGDRDDVWALASGGNWWHRTAAGGPWATGRANLSSGTARGIWGLGGARAWVVGQYVSVRVDGSTSTADTSLREENLEAVWGVPAGRGWAGGHGGRVLRYDGSAWRGEMGAPTRIATSWQRFWGFAANDLWAIRGVGANSDQEVAHWDGASWTPRPLPVASLHLVWLWGSSPDDVWLSTRDDRLGYLFHWTGGAWQRVMLPDSTRYYGIHGTARDDVWVSADTLLHWNGTTWQSRPLPVSGPPGHLWCATRDDCWADGGGMLYRWNGSTWTSTYRVDTFNGTQLWGSGPRDVWAMGGTAYHHFDGTRWAQVPVVGATYGARAGVWGSGPNDVWFVGQRGTLVHWDGAALTATESGARGVYLSAIWGSSAGDVWIGGDEGTLLRRSP